MMGTRVRRRERPAENRGRISKAGMVPSSSQKNTTRLSSFPSCSSATENSSRLRVWIISPAMKFFVASSSGKIRNIADLFEAKLSASMALSKQSTCSSSESRKVFSRESTVDMTEAMDCSAAVRAEPENHLALCSSGRRSMRSWNSFLPGRMLGAISSCTSLNTDTMCRRSRSSPWILLGGKYSASKRVTAVSTPSAAS